MNKCFCFLIYSVRCKSLIPFQGAQQCVLSWTLMHTHYFTLQILGTAHTLKSLETEPSFGIELSLQFVNQKWNESGHVGDNLVVHDESTKVFQFWWIIGSTALAVNEVLAEIVLIYQRRKRSQSWQKNSMPWKREKSSVVLYKQSVLRAQNER